jgi:hypothetical protein
VPVGLEYRGRGCYDGRFFPLWWWCRVVVVAVVVVVAGIIKLVACAVSAKLMRHLHWFRLHFGRTSTPFTNDALNVAISGGVAWFVRCPALHGVEILEYRVVGELPGICKQVILKRGHNLRLGEGVCITGRESASIYRNEIHK